MAIQVRKRAVVFGAVALFMIFGSTSLVGLADSPAGAPLALQGHRLVVDGFEDGDTFTLLGSRWVTYNDSGMGGSSTAELKIMDSGASGTLRAVQVTGRITTDFTYGFAGAAAWLDRSGQPRDMSAYSGIRFYARGDAAWYYVHVLSSAVTDHNEFGRGFLAREEWELVEVPFSVLVQSPYFGELVAWTGTDVRGVAFHVQTLSVALDAYLLEVDEIEFY